MLGTILFGIIFFMLLKHTLQITTHQVRRDSFLVDMNATIQYLGRISEPFDIKKQR